MKPISFLLPGILLVLIASIQPACKKAEDIPTSGGIPEKEIIAKYQLPDGSYASFPMIHLSRDTVYTLSNPITREAGEQLVIDPGTLIKVNTGQALASITINPGGVLMANGTVDAPIVFTSSATTGTQSLNWGGIALQGKSSLNSAGATGDATDFSGSITYVRIEFAGLQLKAVGTRTVVQNVEVSYCDRTPSFEIDGGTFNGSHLISFACGSSADFYISQGYTGRLQYLLAYRHPYFGQNTLVSDPSLAGVYIENSPAEPTDLPTPVTDPVISNLTVLGPDSQAGRTASYGDTTLATAALVTTRHSRFHIRNSVFAGFPYAAWYLADPFTTDQVRTDSSGVEFSFFQASLAANVFYLEPGTLPAFAGADFQSVALASAGHNQVVSAMSDLSFSQILDYSHIDLLPETGSVLLHGADFGTPDFSNEFFEQVSYIGAFGDLDWSKGWTNFTPLTTNYNFPQ